MITVQNTATFVVNIRGTLSIPPLGRAEVDENLRGVADLIERGTLVPVKGKAAKGGDSGAGTGGEGGDKPISATELKAKLDALGVRYRGNASAQALQALYDEAVAAASTVPGTGGEGQSDDKGE